MLALGFLDPAWSEGLGNPAPTTGVAVYKAKFDTSKGPFVIEVHRDWAPNGADRFYNLVKNGFFDNAGFFRVISGFMVQFGINGDPKISGIWREARIKDDPARQSNKRGPITFATAGVVTPAPLRFSSISPTIIVLTDRALRRSVRSSLA